MNLLPPNPMAFLDNLKKEVNRILDIQVMNEKPAASPSDWSPSANIYQRQTDYLVQLEVPYVHAEDIQVSVIGNELVITGHRHRPLAQPEGGRLWLSEIVYGKFYRQFTLPDKVDQEGTYAQLKQGVLAVTLPKARVQSRSVVVNEALSPELPLKKEEMIIADAVSQ